MIARTGRLPVTLISGFTEAGKTSLVNHLIRELPHPRLAVIVPPSSRAALNTGGRELVVQALPGLYECRIETGSNLWLRGDLLVAVDRVARQGWADYLIIESPDTEPPLPVAQTFAFRDPSDYSLGDLAVLDTLVTVVDTPGFLPEYLSGNVLPQKQPEAECDDATSPHLLACLVEFCDVLLLNKADRVARPELERLAAVCRQLNPDAHIIPTQFGRVSPARVVGTGLFDLRAAQRAAGWLQRLRGVCVPNCEVHQVGGFVYRARQPFHPERLWRYIQGDRPGVLECKGYFWLATRNDDVGAWAQCGPVCHVARVGRWWADVPKEEWPTSPVARRRIETNWRWPHGDRRQDLVFTCLGIDEEQVRRELDDCLLTEAEMDGGPETWACMDDPFPYWHRMTLRNCSLRRTIIRNR